MIIVEEDNQITQMAQYFQQELCQATLDGLLITSALDPVAKCLDVFIQNGIIDISEFFCDAGCGDGRIVALTAEKYIPSIGVDSDDEVSRNAQAKISKLKKRGVIKAPALILNGNFLHKQTYKKAGISFRDIRTFFNYVNNQDSLARKIALESPKGTVFLLYDFDPIPEDFIGLTFVETAAMGIGYQRSMEPHYLHAYQK